jgi:hypothetical protein
MDTAQLQDVFLRITTLKQQGLSSEEILQRLLDTGLSGDAAQQYFNEWKKIRIEKKRNAAFIYCGVGVFLLTTGLFLHCCCSTTTATSILLYMDLPSLALH